MNAAPPFFPLSNPTESEAAALHSCNIQSFSEELNWLSNVTGVDTRTCAVIKIPSFRIKAATRSSVSYLILDNNKKPLAIMKPADEEPNALYGIKTEGLRLGIDPGSSITREALTYFISKLCLTQSVPTTLRYYVHCESFLGEHKTKLVSIQKMIPDAIHWLSILASKKAISTKSIQEALRLHYLTNNNDGHGDNILADLGMLNFEKELLIFSVDNAFTFSGLELPSQSVLIAAKETALPYNPSEIDPLQLKNEVFKAFPEVATSAHLSNALEIFLISLQVEKRLLEEGYSPYFTAGLFLSLGHPGLKLEDDFIKHTYRKSHKDLRQFSKNVHGWIDALIGSDKETLRYFMEASPEIQKKVKDILDGHPQNCQFSTFPSLSIINMLEVVDDSEIGPQEHAKISILSPRLIERLVLTLAYQEVWEAKNRPSYNKKSLTSIFQSSSALYNLQTHWLNMHDNDFKNSLKKLGWDFNVKDHIQKTFKEAIDIMRRLQTLLEE